MISPLVSSHHKIGRAVLAGGAAELSLARRGLGPRQAGSMATELRGSSPGTQCKAPKTGSLMSVVISGLVTSSKMPGVHKNSTVNIQFLAEPQGLIREVPGQGVVYDGISPYKICPEDFDVKFSTGVKVPAAHIVTRTRTRTRIPALPLALTLALTPTRNRTPTVTLSPTS